MIFWKKFIICWARDYCIRKLGTIKIVWIQKYAEHMGSLCSTRMNKNVCKWNTVVSPLEIAARGGSNTKIPNIEHFEHWHTELRTFRTWLLYFKTELRTGKTEHRTFIGINQAWIFDQILGVNFFFRQKNCLLQNVKFCCN